MSAKLSAGVANFAATLRREHGFTAGPGETFEALCALEAIGVSDRSRAKAALRCVFCTSYDEIATFDRAFDAYFNDEPAGIPQRRVRETGDGPLSSEAVPEPPSAQAWEAMRARYSPAPGSPRAPQIRSDGYERADADARRLIARVRAGRSRRWRPHQHGRRLDVRRTLRAGSRNAGEPIDLRLLGRPRRDPRFILLIDGSRSMTDYAGSALQFALALCRRTRRARAFTFSTGLHERTRELRDIHGREASLPAIGEAWGGGTRIGASLRAFLRTYGSSIDDRSYVMIFSDGLDTGEVPLLRNAMRELSRRSAAVMWVNPHAGEPGFTPSAAGMRAALPYVSALVATPSQPSNSGRSGAGQLPTA